MTRYSAFAIHLGISFLIFLVLAYMIVFVWYPGILFDTDGGWRGMQIIIGVDFCSVTISTRRCSNSPAQSMAFIFSRVRS